MKKPYLIIFALILLTMTSCDNTQMTTDSQTLATSSDEISTTIQTDEVITSIETTQEVLTTEEITNEKLTTLPTTIVDETTLEPTTEEVTTESIDEIGLVEGIGDQEVIVNHYFNPMKNVSAFSTKGENISSMIEISGHVDYGTVGNYQLTYQLTFKNDLYEKQVTISVVEDTYVQESGSRPSSEQGPIILDEGSYFSGQISSIAHPRNPGYIADYLLNDAIPSSGWWTALVAENYGGSNGLYLNPLRTAFSNEGLEITNPLDGFVQYWNDGTYQTIAQFPIALRDSFLKSSDLNLGYITEVIDYSDALVKVSMKNNADDIDQMVVTLTQGSPYIFVETANKNALSLTMDSTVQLEYYDLDGQQITSRTYDGKALIVKMVARHSGYDTSPPANVGQPQYTDKFYMINLPNNSSFTISNNIINMSLGDGNYLSLVSLNDLTEASFYHAHAYTMMTGSSMTYNIDYKDNLVHTSYDFSTQNFEGDSKALLALMPHHYKNSQVELSDYSYRTVRGTLKIFQGQSFQTTLSFDGLLPGYTIPENASFDSIKMVEYLNDLDQRTEMDDTENFLNDEGPYWNSKAIYPLSQGLIIADQLGEELLKLSFMQKLRYILSDWYTYDGPADERFLYYNNEWGSVYYSNDDFATASTLSDHSFTHGYLIYGSAVLAMYDHSFIEDYGQMVDLLLDDYMFTDKDNANYAYLRNFDPWAGHTWAHGFGTFAEGNNLESTSEALNSWNAGYLWALANQDQERMEAAIYGFVTEISAVKEYWFDYDEENWDPAYGDYVDVAGMVWGGKHDYATWFGANPTFIYGIQWLPAGEYLTNYVLNDQDYEKLSSIYQTYLQAKNGIIDTWYSNMWSIQAIIDSNIAIDLFDETLILNDDYPAELSGTYWMIHALDTLGRRHVNVWMPIHASVTSTIYQNDSGQVYAMLWNPTPDEQEVEFHNEEGLLMSYVIEAYTFEKIKIIE
jgi:endoglucanase Acf2